MRRALPHVIALLLGAGAALLVACGGGGTKGGIPAASAGELKSELASLQSTVQDGHCDQIGSQLKEVDSEIDGLPGTVDERLRSSLRNASELLRTTALDQCDKTTQTTQTTTTQTQTETQTQPTDTQTQTQTQPTQTSTVPSQTTTTPPTPTQPTKTATNPAQPPVTPPPPPPVTPPATTQPAPGSGGGATPGIQR
ncbi:MAG TPA: hypothetical protein VGF63_10320 [Solirubrobacteraceae bacterium]|jgi:cell division protein FtsN